MNVDLILKMLKLALELAAQIGLKKVDLDTLWGEVEEEIARIDRTEASDTAIENAAARKPD